MILEERGTLKPLSPEYTGSGIDEWGEQDELRHPYRVIHYYYPIDGIAEEVYKRTSVIGKTRRTKDGKSLMSDIALTPDEREEFMSLCRNASTEVYSVIEPFIDDGVLSCFFDEDDPGLLTAHSVHYIIRHPRWVPDNSVYITDRRIFEALVTNIIAEWFMTAYPEEAQVRMAVADNAVTAVKVSLNSHRPMTVRSHPF